MLKCEPNAVFNELGNRLDVSFSPLNCNKVYYKASLRSHNISGLLCIMAMSPWIQFGESRGETWRVKGAWKEVPLSSQAKGPRQMPGMDGRKHPLGTSVYLSNLYI